MPIFLEPGQEFQVVLECDKDKPEQSRPVFICKSQSGRGQIRLGEFLDTEFTGTIRTLLELHADEVLVHCTGWKNIPEQYPFNKDSLIDVLSLQEMREILRKIMTNQHVQAEEKKS